MKFIAHRGNLFGVNPKKENILEYIQTTISKGYDAEIDIWCMENGTIWLGHDKPTKKVHLSDLYPMKDNLWIHCKNLLALTLLKDSFNAFYHNVDAAVLTSKAYIWVYPGQQLFSGSIAVMPETVNPAYTLEELSKCYAICTDEVIKYELCLRTKSTLVLPIMRL